MNHLIAFPPGHSQRSRHPAELPRPGGSRLSGGSSPLQAAPGILFHRLGLMSGLRAPEYLSPAAIPQGGISAEAVIETAAESAANTTDNGPSTDAANALRRFEVVTDRVRLPELWFDVVLRGHGTEARNVGVIAKEERDHHY